MNRFTKKLLGYLPVSYFLAVVCGFVFICFYMLLGAGEEESVEVPIEEFYPVIGILAIIALVVFIILCIYGYFYYKTSGYQLTDKEIICVRGVLFKKKSIIEYKKIHAVNKKQGLIQKLFGIAVLTVDSGSTNTSSEAEVMIYEESSVVDKLIYKLKNIDNITEELSEEPTISKSYLYKFSSVRKFIYSCLTTTGSLIAMAIIFGVVILVFWITKLGFEDGLTILDLILLLLTVYISVNGFAFVIQLIYSFISLHDFKVEKDQDSLNINYGLFVSHNNTFKLDRIKGVKIEQGLIKRLFGFATVKLEVIGYDHYANGNESSESEGSQNIGLLIPLCKMSELNGYLSEILSDYVPLEKNGKAKDFKAFIAMPVLITAIVLGLILLCVSPLFMLINDPIYIYLIVFGIIGLFLILVLCYLINAIFAYPRQSISISDDRITIFNGSLNHTTTVIKKENLIAIEDITTYHRAKKGIYSYMIHFHTNASSNVVKVNHLDESLKNQLLSLLKY